MKKLSDLLVRVRGKDVSHKDSVGVSLISRVFIKAFNRCPICDQDFVDHYCTLLSVIPAWKVEAVTDLVNKVKDHQWAAARGVKEFDPAQDAIEVMVLRCPGKRLAVVILSDPYEPYHNSSVLEYEVLDNECSQDLRSVVGEAKWMPII